MSSSPWRSPACSPSWSSWSSASSIAGVAVRSTNIDPGRRSLARMIARASRGPAARQRRSILQDVLHLGLLVGAQVEPLADDLIDPLDGDRPQEHLRAV